MFFSVYFVSVYVCEYWEKESENNNTAAHNKNKIKFTRLASGAFFCVFAGKKMFSENWLKIMI